MSSTLADRLNRLFDTVKPAGRSSYKNVEVAEATGLSETYIKYLRSGARDNPSMQNLLTLAKFFGVSATYFYDDAAAEAIDLQLQVLQNAVDVQTRLRDRGVERLALRLGDLTPDGLAVIEQLVNVLLGRQTSPEADSPAPDSEPGDPKKDG